MQDIRLRLDWSRAAPGLFKAREVFQRRIQGATSRVERVLCGDILAAMSELLLIRARSADTLRPPDQDGVECWHAAQDLGDSAGALLESWTSDKGLRARMFLDEDGAIRVREPAA